MALTAGTQLRPYRIDRLIGAGGMGEVYRARDTSLKRDVALKTLPQSLATDSERLARFRREVQVLASLNHPNITAIYGLDRETGRTLCRGEAAPSVRSLDVSLEPLR
jgi:eukaryotic-like serine/threonine-protein kinase